MIAHAHHAPSDLGGPRQPLIITRGLSKTFALRGRSIWRKERVRAVDDVSFEVMKRECLGIVGESGSGKSTMARLLMRLATPDAGEVIFDGQAVDAMRGLSVRELRRAMQMVFQDSAATLNPRLSIGESIAFGPRASGTSRAEARGRAHEALQRVGLTPGAYERRLPHELSGGQRQRANIARALAMRGRLRARQIGRGADSKPARRPPSGSRPHLSVHFT
jgi:peptide/nickel transport system ATP-binding protein